MDFDTDLDKFAHHFIGYGNLDSPLWFIGMEEGGGNSKEEIELRLKAWKDLNCPNVTDICDFHERIEHGFLFKGKVKLQKTWAKLIAFQLSLIGLESSKEELRTFQRDNLGRSDSNNALLELMPLPSPGIKKWFYNSFSTLPYLESRKKYFNEMIDMRILMLQREINKYKPRIVLFYGFGYNDYWNKIAGLQCELHSEEEIYLGIRDNICFVITKHPVSFIEKEYFEKVGKLISKITSK